MHHFRFVSAAVSPFTQAFIRLSWRSSVLFELIMKTLRHRSAGLLTTSLLLAGVSALAPTSVRAGNTCSFGGNPDAPACRSGFVFDAQGDKKMNLVQLPTAGMGTVQFVLQGNDTWVVDVDFIPDLMKPLVGWLEFDITVDPFPNLFELQNYGLVITGPPIGTTSPEFKVKTTSADLPMIMADQTNPVITGLFDSGVTTTRIRNDYSVTQGSINTLQNSFTQRPRGDIDRVPGPLPLLGAGAAFGFSRRLRTRVLAARGA